MVTAKEIEDVYIAVMGVTGAGKSSFIATCSGKDVRVGHDLVSCTADVEDVSFMYNDHLRIHLIDTPGFDDTNRSDVAVLQDISYWLAASFQNQIRLKGIIFLHRISDPRMTGAARRNLSMFKKLCGPNAFKSVILATTMWSKVEPAEGDRRERELIESPEFWGSMHKRGSAVMRYLNNKNSAHEIIDYILNLHVKEPVVLDIQDELVTQKKQIEDTSAAVELNAEIMRERKKHQEELARIKQEMQEAIDQRDKELQEDFQEEIEALQKKIQKGVAEQRKLTETLEEVHKRKEAEFQAFKEQVQHEQEEANRRHERELERQRHEGEQQAESMRKLYEVEVQRLQDREQEIKRQQEQFDRELRDVERRRVEADEANRRALEQERERMAREQQAAREQQKREMEALRLERERKDREYEAARERERQQERAELRKMKADMEQERREREERLRRRQPGSGLGPIGTIMHGIASLFLRV